MKTCKEIRSEFIEFFEQRGHTFVPSSPLLPAEDPTLLFANAGMNQFKDIFLGRETREYTRAVNTQKCIRAGGKHNDLEDVGHDVYHHTFFEMLGNWSFGDYFKREAIEWAWELLTDVWSLPKERLHVTVFEGDKSENLEPDAEAEKLWKEATDVDPSHVHHAGKKDNFWEMGAVGPCGPCSEIHIDLTDDLSGASLVNADDQRVIELWNLVFIQYNRDENGKLTPLPAKHVDTGLGLERIGKILQGKKSNYATDLWIPIIEKIETLTEHRYGASAGLEDRFDVLGEDDIGDVAARVVADHARALTFAITDGVIPSNEGRGYVLRRILRRAARYGRQYLNIDGPFLAKLVPTIVELMGEAFSELTDRRDYVIETIREEEESFGRTLDRGIELFQREADQLAEAGQKKLPGDAAFDLYATYGFPVDLTQVMAAERGMTVDLEGYEAAMEEHREVSGAGDAFRTVEISDLPATDDSSKYSRAAIDAKVLGWVIDGKFISEGRLFPDTEAGVVLNRTNFYGEQGGQVGDTGELRFEGGCFDVTDTIVAGQSILHVGRLSSGTLAIGQKIVPEVSSQRLDIMRNHTGTHLLNWALREVLGDHVNQAGSVVAPDRLRFDFTHNRALTPEQLTETERLVNQRILADQKITAKVIPLDEARRIPGVRAVFGEKYPDPVRVITTGKEGDSTARDHSFSVELCGGTHLERTSQIGLFKILSEEAVAKGVRRITAVTGTAAVQYVQEADQVLRSVGAALRVGFADIPQRIAGLQEELKRLRKRSSSGPAGEEFRPTEKIATPDGEFLIGQVEQASAPEIRNLCDRLRQRGTAGAMIASVTDDKVLLIAMVCEKLVKSGKLKAGDWVNAAAAIVGGKGGGRPTLAQAGGKQVDKLPDALEAAGKFVREKLA